MQTAHESVQSAPPHGLCTLFVWRIRSLPVQACHGGHVELLHGKGWKRPTWRARPRLLTITGRLPYIAILGVRFVPYRRSLLCTPACLFGVTVDTNHEFERRERFRAQACFARL